MNRSQKYLKGLSKDMDVETLCTNTPEQYSDRGYQYMSTRTALFDENRAYLSTDFYRAKAQGIVANDFYKYISLAIRLADISKSKGSSYFGRKSDDVKQVLFADTSVDYFPIGAKLLVAGNTWLCINPENMSSAKATAVVGRCNSSYNSYDCYGNVITEPIILEKTLMSSNSDEMQKNLVLPDGYFNVVCQRNENTKVIGQNYRLILGSQAFFVTGVTDFIQEFSGDRNSCNIMSFTIRKEEVINEQDDLEKYFIADGKTKSFAIEINENVQIDENDSLQLTPTFIVDGNAQTATQEMPITWIYKTSNESVATVDENGIIHGVSVGNAEITVQLAQNNGISAVVMCMVGEAENAPYVAFKSIIPTDIVQYDTATLSAAYFVNGVESDDRIKWSFSNTNPSDFIATISEDGKSVEIMCLSPSDYPLKVIASHGGYSISTDITLSGY